MIRLFLYKVCFALCALGMSSIGLAIDVMVKKKTANVRKDPLQQSEPLLKLKRGETIKALKRTGTYWQVATADGKIGYISIFKVKRTSSHNTSFAKALRNAVKADRTTDAVNGVRARSSVMGVRGLSSTQSTAFASNVRPNHMMVYAMEDATVNSKRLRRLEFSVQKELKRLQKRRSHKKAH